MGYPDELLAVGERVVLHRHPHGGLLVGPVLTFLLAVGTAGYLAAVARDQDGQTWAWPVIAVVAVLLVGWLTVAPVVRWRSTHLVVTTRRLLVREGVRRRRSLEVPLDRITAVRARRRWPGRVLGWGALVVVAGADGEVEFGVVPGVDEVRAVLQRAATRGVRRPAEPG